MHAQVLAFPQWELADVEASDAFSQVRTALSAAQNFLDHQEVERQALARTRHAEVAEILADFAGEIGKMHAVIEERVSS